MTGASQRIFVPSQTEEDELDLAVLLDPDPLNREPSLVRVDLRLPGVDPELDPHFEQDRRFLGQHERVWVFSYSHCHFLDEDRVEEDFVERHFSGRSESVLAGIAWTWTGVPWLPTAAF